MKTKVRVLKSRTGNYDNITLQILGPKFNSTSRYLESIGQITWQGDSHYGWYAMRFLVDAEVGKHHNLLAMYKLACYIKDRVTNDSSPVEVMGIIGGEEHFALHGELLSIADNGKQVYNVVKGSAVQCRIVAPNSVMGYRIIDGMKERKELTSESYSLDPVGERLQFTPTNLIWTK